MADIDIDPFGEHESRPEEPTDEHIPLDPVTPGRSTWEPTREQRTSFGGRESQRTKLMKDYVKDLYKKLSENIGETPELFHYDYFKLEGRELYYIGNRKPLTTEGKLKSVGMLADILRKSTLRRLGFNIPVGKVTARQAVILNKAAEELPSTSNITGVDDIELQEIAEKASDIISQIKDVQTDTPHSNTTLAEKIRTLFRDQRITIASILTAIGMAIGVLVEALLPGGGGAAAASGGGEPPKDKAGLKEWIRKKLKALASLLGKLRIKAAEALPGIIGGIISWILNRAKDVVGWVSQNLWALVVGIGGLIYIPIW